jgi:cytosine/adenosine deaminase-related metal-dependent hydrolase
MTRILIQGGWVVSIDDDIGIVAGADVLIEDGRIVAVGKDVAAGDAEIIDAGGMIVMPGLVNTHLHSWQTGIRGIAGDWSLAQYFQYIHRGMAASFTPEDIYLGTLVGALNQLDMGVTTLFDWLHNNPTPDHSDGGLDGLVESGIRALFGHGSPKHAPKPGEPHFSEIPHPRAEIERLRKGRLAADGSLVGLAMCILGPHFSAYDVVEADLRLAAEFDLIASMHMDAGFARKAPDGIHRMLGDGLIDRRVNIVDRKSVV